MLQNGYINGAILPALFHKWLAFWHSVHICDSLVIPSITSTKKSDISTARISIGYRFNQGQGNEHDQHCEVWLNINAQILYGDRDTHNDILSLVFGLFAICMWNIRTFMLWFVLLWSYSKRVAMSINSSPIFVKAGSQVDEVFFENVGTMSLQYIGGTGCTF